MVLTAGALHRSHSLDEHALIYATWIAVETFAFVLRPSQQSRTQPADREIPGI
jgi:hypothetical protein